MPHAKPPSPHIATPDQRAFAKMLVSKDVGGPHNIYYTVLLTEEEITKKRALTLVNPSWKDIEAFTCDTCKDKASCSLSFDPYNVEGDCLRDLVMAEAK